MLHTLLVVGNFGLCDCRAAPPHSSGEGNGVDATESMFLIRGGTSATDVKIGIRSGRRAIAIDGGEARKSHIGMRMSLSPNANTASTEFESEATKEWSRFSGT